MAHMERIGPKKKRGPMGGIGPNVKKMQNGEGET
jgi:hypothetical protein